MRLLRYFGLALAISLPCGIAAANNDTDDGFIWIDANTRIRVKPVPTFKPVSTTAGGGATAPEKAPEKTGKKEKPAK